MAYPISNALKALFASNSRQEVGIRVETASRTFELSGANIKEGSFSLNRYCSSGNYIEIGSVIAAELTITLDNSDGTYNNTEFFGAEMFVYLGTQDWSDPEAHLSSIPLGVFEVDSAPKVSRSITIKALDRCVLFDKRVVDGAISYPVSVANMVSRICDICNVTLYTNVAALPNGNYVIQSAPTGKDLTYRQLLSWCAEITGTCAYMDWNGQLRLQWYTSVPNETLTISNRFSSSLEKTITITGIQITENDTVYITGEEGYLINIEGNSLIQGGEDTILSNLSPVLVDFTYAPYTAVTIPKPYLYPLDVISFTDEDDNTYTAPITDITIAANKNTAIKARGESEVEKGYAASNPLTNRQRVIIEEIERQQNETLNTRVRDVIAFNELITNSMGLYSTSVTQSDGSVKLYLHNLPVLEESDTIFTATANGIAWTTTGWNEGSPVWSYGVTAAGNALFKLLSAEGINISKVGNDYHIEVTPSTFTIYYRDMVVTTINADTMEIPRVKIDNYINFGNMRIVKSNNGIDFIFAD